MKLNNRIMLAVATYYLNRYRYRHGKQWNKTADLETIAALCEEAGLQVTASAGTFWFRRRTGKSIHEMTEQSFPLFNLTVARA